MRLLLPWQRVADRAREQADRAEARLAEVRARRQAAERHGRLSEYWMAENHISPKLRAIIREGRR